MFNRSQRQRRSRALLGWQPDCKTTGFSKDGELFDDELIAAERVKQIAGIGYTGIQ